ncbi:MAG: hypothetical protein IJB00_07180 [Akkermansia sp.]|nr:hypothetical protein [Akkermansia sp.]
MKRIFLAVIVAASVSSCTLTGDPTKGGIFWSPSKAAERQALLLAEMNKKQLTVSSLESSNNSLQARKNKLNKELNELKAKRNSTTSDKDIRELNAAIDALEAELNNM